MRRTLAVMTCLCFPTLGAAEEPTDESGAAVVTTSARAAKPEFATERSVTVVGEEAISERQPVSITGALQGQPGVTTQSTNRGAGTLILRGLVGPENLIFVDGVRFSQSTFRTGPNQYLDTIDPWGLRRIEVVRGPAGVLFGAGAMGGIVEAHPFEVPDETTAIGRFGFHSADHTASAAADGGSRTEGVAARAGVTMRRHGQLRVGSNGPANELFASGVDGNSHLSQGYDDLHLRAATAVDIGEQRIRANYMGARVRDAMRLDRLGAGEVRVYDNEDHLAYITGELDAGAVGADLNVSWHRTGEVVRRFGCDMSGGVVGDRLACANLDRSQLARQRRNNDVVDTLGTSLNGATSVPDTTLHLQWGWDAYFDFVQSDRADAAAPNFVFQPAERGNFADGSRYRTVGLFALARHDLVRYRQSTLRLHAGARVENFAARAENVSDEIGDVDYSHTGIVGSAGAAWIVGTTVNAYLNWNQGYRAPNLQETTALGDSGNFYEVPNPDLGPERNDTFELGGKLDWAEILRLEAALWVSLLSDRITREPTTFGDANEVDGKEVRRRVNRDFGYFVGTDLAAQTHDYGGVSIFGSVSWTDGAVEAGAEDDTFVKGPFHALFAGDRDFQNPRRLPPISTAVGLRYKPVDGAYFSFFMQSATPQTKLAPDDRADLRICEASAGRLSAECEGTPGWLTFNARAGYRYENLRLDVSALNLTDERYRHHGSGVLAAGFDLAAQVTLQY